jgi:glucan-binding YG repeat protein
MYIRLIMEGFIMNKNIKRIIAITLAIGGISAAEPSATVNFLTVKASAATSDADTLDNLELQDEDDDSIQLYKDSDYTDETATDEVEEGETYYAETSSDKVNIDNIDGADEDHVRIFKGSSETAYEVGDDISLSSGTTTLKVRVYEDAYDDYDDYDEANDSNYNEYEIKVENTGDDESSCEDENDDDTLDSLKLSDKDDSNIKLYDGEDYEERIANDDVEEGNTYYAKTSSDEVKITTDGPDDSYIKIFRSTSNSAKGVDPGDSILVSGDKTLTVRIYSEEPDSDVTYEEDENVIGEYTIKLEYNDEASTTTSETTDDSSKVTQTTNNSTTTEAAANVVNNIVANQWIQANGKWQYNDALGQQIKNTWFYDRNLGKSYYLQADGNMATEWLSLGGKWYYLGFDGAMKTGWQLANGSWYYLNNQGVMLYNTTIDGYKLGPNGAWIK